MSRPRSPPKSAKQTAELVKAVEALHHTEKELEERTAGRAVWKTKLRELRSEQVALYRESRWVKLGRKVGSGSGFRRRVDMALLKRLLRALPLLLLSPLLVRDQRLGARAHRISSAKLRTGRRSVAPDGQRRRLIRRAPPSSSPTGTAETCWRNICPRWSRRSPAIRPTKSSWWITAPPMAAPSSSARHFPQVKLVALPNNLGFGGGSNAGFRAATNDIVVLLNSDMRVAPDFLAPLLEGFADPDGLRRLLPDLLQRSRASSAKRPASRKAGGRMAACACAIASTRPSTALFPCFYGGGGSCAFDRAQVPRTRRLRPRCSRPSIWKTPTSAIMAWKRGWKVLYQPRSVVYHEHRGTIGKRFREDQIQAVLKKNFLLFCWKNIHEWPRLASHFFFAWAGALLSVLFGEIPGAPTFLACGARSCSCRGAMRSRWRARSLARIDDTEAFRRPLGGYFRDRFAPMEPAPGPPARAVRFALSDLPADARRRRLHVPDAARDGAS